MNLEADIRGFKLLGHDEDISFSFNGVLIDNKVVRIEDLFNNKVDIFVTFVTGREDGKKIDKIEDSENKLGDTTDSRSELRTTVIRASEEGKLVNTKEDEDERAKENGSEDGINNILNFFLITENFIEDFFVLHGTDERIIT